MKRQRRSIRLRGYDYRQAGAYYITSVTQNRICLLGQVIETAMQLNAAGQMIRACWLDISSHFRNISLDEFIVMPNHLHGLIVISNDIAPESPGPASTLSHDVGAGSPGPAPRR